MKYASFCAAFCLLTACSLINSLDSVKPAVEEKEGGTGGKGGKGGKGGAGANDAGTGGTSSGGMAGTSGSAGASGLGGGGLDGGLDSSVGGTGAVGAGGRGGGGTGTTPDAGDGSTFTPGGPNGAVVLYDTKNKKLVVLDPTNGHALSSEDSPIVRSIANDPLTDNWYVFLQPTSDVKSGTLQVRQLNTTTGEWKNLGKPIALPTPATANVGVLNKRIAYLSTDATDPTVATFTVLDTSKPDAVVVIGAKNRMLPAGTKLALIANPDPNDVGGTGTIVIQSCAGIGDCDVSLLRETINATTVAEDTPKQVGKLNPTGGGLGVGYDVQNRQPVVVFPPTSLAPLTSPVACKANQGPTGTVSEFDPATNSSVGNPVSFDMASLRVSGAAFDYCHQIAFATSLLDDPAVWAIPLSAGGSPYKLCATAGGTMLFEPYTHSVMRVPTTGDHLEMYNILDKNAAMPTLMSRTFQTPNFLLATSVITVRQPLSGQCK